MQETGKGTAHAAVFRRGCSRYGWMGTDGARPAGQAGLSALQRTASRRAGPPAVE